ncbi:MAG TPA: hypothetical protein VGS20_11650 [Candidatus Acidoferrales bacterium]|nr:hypothetical protein [Candidatus Acidoferrales bacterium]
MIGKIALVLVGSVAFGYWLGVGLGPARPAVNPAQSQLPALLPGQPTAAMYWSIDTLRKIHAERIAIGPRSQGEVGRGQATPFRGERFRTHSIGFNTRFYWDLPRPSNLTGTVSHYDDAEQHEGVSDFYVIIGGSGKILVDGVIANRQYRRASGPDSLLLPGEFVGQPVENATVYTVKPGDWLNIPPNTPHWQQPDPNAGMSYLLLKINIGLYPGSLSR